MDWLTLQRVFSALLPDRPTLILLGYVAIIVIFAFLEAGRPAFKGGPTRSKRWPTNFGIGLINIALAIAAPVSAVIAAYWAQRNGYGFLKATAAPWWIVTVVTILGRSFAGYALHYVMHKTPLLWRVHRVHHSDVHLDVSTALRSHPIEALLLVGTTVLAAIVLGMDPVVLAAYELVEAAVHIATHANLRLPERLDRALRFLVVTPNMHSLHHSAWHRETDSNYGTVFSIWDRMFGTYSPAPRGGYDSMQIGLKEIRDERASDFVWQMKSPIIANIASTDETSKK